MTHKNDFVACIKANGKILREQNQQVAVPFGSEYSILVKNLKSVRAMVEITIDGESVTDKQKLILSANSEIDLERYIKNSNLSKGNKFKFIEFTDEIENHRGIKANDGLVRVEFWPEKRQPFIFDDWDKHNSNPWPDKWPYPKPKYPDSGITYTSSGGKYDNILRSCQMGQTLSTNSCQVFSNSMNCSITPGITVPGGLSEQKFVYGDSFNTETVSTVIVFQLIGKSNEQIITQPVTVKSKPKCITCGRQNKVTNKFCSQCGTSLVLF